MHALPHMRIIVSSHNFSVGRLSPRGRELCITFSKKFVAWGWEKSRHGYSKVPVKVYASALKDRSCFRFHINALPEFKQLLEESLCTGNLVEWHTNNMAIPKVAEFQVKPMWVAKDYQIPIIDYLSLTQPVSKIAELQTGLGKAQPLTALVQTPTGWKTMGSLLVGDQVVASDGTAVPILGIYPQGEKDIYRVTFEDGRSAECCKEHLWSVYAKKEITYTDALVSTNPLILTTELIIDLLNGGESELSIDLVKPHNQSTSKLNDQYGVGKRIAFAKGDLGPAPINPHYFAGTANQRLMLLRGLLDVAGMLGLDQETIYFTSHSKALLFQVQYLVRSLGGMAFLSEHSLNHFALRIVHPTPRELFTHYAIALPKPGTKELKLKLVSVELIKRAPAQCLFIDHPNHLYVTNDFIVTHNTFCSLQAVANVGHRVVLITKASFLEKWLEDFTKTFECITDEILVVKGSGQLMKLLDLAEEGKLTEKAILISSATFRNYLKDYEDAGEELRDMGYACMPYEFFEFVGAGVRLVDECHQDFHFYFKLDTYTHITSSISLSATLITDDLYLQQMYKVMFPLKDRLPKRDLDKYIDSIAVHYSHKNTKVIRTEEYGSTTYSHMAYERSLLKQPEAKLHYCQLVQSILELSYFRDKQPGEKAIVFAASVDMCTEISNYLKRQYPHLDVRRYVEDDPYENVLDADIRVTTIGSGGTAIDIPDLSCTIMTTAIQSIQANVQALGRLRKRTNGKVEFYYFVADDVEKSVQYHLNKKIMLTQRAKTFKEIYSGHVL